MRCEFSSDSDHMHGGRLPEGMHVMMMRGDAEDGEPLAGVSAEHCLHYTDENDCVNSLIQYYA